MEFRRATETESIDIYREYFDSLKNSFDDFYEEMILESDIYLIIRELDIIGVFSINEKALINVFIYEQFSTYFDIAVKKIIKQNELNEIRFTTNDIQVMNFIIESKFPIELFASNYVYKYENESNITLREATLQDLPVIKATYSDFLDNYDELVAQKMLYVHCLENEPIVMVNTNKHKLYNDHYSIGVIVDKNHRNNALGRNAIRFISNKLMAEGKQVHAGCWYYNYASKKMLNKAGFIHSNLLCSSKITQDIDKQEKNSKESQ